MPVGHFRRQFCGREFSFGLAAVSSRGQIPAGWWGEFMPPTPSARSRLALLQPALDSPGRHERVPAGFDFIVRRVRAGGAGADAVAQSGGRRPGAGSSARRAGGGRAGGRGGAGGFAGVSCGRVAGGWWLTGVSRRLMAIRSRRAGRSRKRMSRTGSGWSTYLRVRGEGLKDRGGDDANHGVGSFHSAGVQVSPTTCGHAAAADRLGHISAWPSRTPKTFWLSLAGRGSHAACLFPTPISSAHRHL